VTRSYADRDVPAVAEKCSPVVTVTAQVAQQHVLVIAAQEGRSDPGVGTQFYEPVHDSAYVWSPIDVVPEEEQRVPAVTAGRQQHV
jgi:hypothetical protein